MHVSHLRKKLGDDPRAPRLIKTVRGVGYVMAAPDNAPARRMKEKRRVSWHRHRHDHDHGHGGHRHHPGCGHPFYDHLPAERRAVPLGSGDGGGARAPARAGGGASARSCTFTTARTCTTACSAGSARRSSSASATTILASHLGRAWLTAHPWRAVLLFGIPALCLWTAAGRIARRISEPIYELTRAAKEIGQGNLAARASLGRGAIGEIGVLSSAFNDMAVAAGTPADRAARAAGGGVARAADAARAHQAAGGDRPAIRRRGRERYATSGAPAKIAPATLDDIEREAIEIDTLVGELLASARLEFQAVTRKPLEAGEAARRALERAGEDAAKLAAPPGPLPFVADPTLIARALANLIDNARKHGGGLDGIAVRAGDGTVVFEVSDRGPGFAPGDEARVFDRFYRGGADARGGLTRAAAPTRGTTVRSGSGWRSFSASPSRTAGAPAPATGRKAARA